MSDRQQLVQNAVAFLADPKSQASPLAQRIQFLEAKGLTPQEIDFAFQQANSSRPTVPTYSPVQYGNAFAPPASGWDWRDYFITTVVSGTLAYGAVSLFKKYLLPHLQPPSSTAYEEDRDALTAQFDAAEALLKEIQAESAAVRAAVEEQAAKIEKTTATVDAVVAEVRQGENKTRDEMREIREEVNTIRDMLPKMIEKNKEAQTHSINELQQELKSLKTILLTRAPSTPPATLPTLGKPAIPAWQLASSPSSPGPTSASVNGKGKEVATESGSSSSA